MSSEREKVAVIGGLGAIGIGLIVAEQIAQRTSPPTQVQPVVPALAPSPAPDADQLGLIIAPGQIVRKIFKPDVITMETRMRKLQKRRRKARRKGRTRRVRRLTSRIQRIKSRLRKRRPDIKW